MATKRKTKRRVTGTAPKKRRRIGAVKMAGPARRRRTRRRIGAASDMTGMLMTSLGLVAGSVAARELNTLVQNQFSLSNTVSGLGQVAIGFVLPMVVKNNKFVQDMGYGMIANGGMVLAVSTGLINGEMPKSMTYRINGPSLPQVSPGHTLPVVSGISNLPVVSGTTAPKSVTVSNYRPTKKLSHIY